MKLTKKGLFYRIIGTNAVYHEELLKREWFISTDVSGLFANVITRIHYNQSLSELLDNRNIIEKITKIQNTPGTPAGTASTEATTEQPCSAANAEENKAPAESETPKAEDK